MSLQEELLQFPESCVNFAKVCQSLFCHTIYTALISSGLVRFDYRSLLYHGICESDLNHLQLLAQIKFGFGVPLANALGIMAVAPGS